MLNGGRDHLAAVGEESVEDIHNMWMPCTIGSV
jgi:hypothetical protein